MAAIFTDGSRRTIIVNQCFEPHPTLITFCDYLANEAFNMTVDWTGRRMLVRSLIYASYGTDDRERVIRGEANDGQGEITVEQLENGNVLVVALINGDVSTSTLVQVQFSRDEVLRFTGEISENTWERI